jgi:predicted GNAT family acetyltransferase
MSSGQLASRLVRTTFEMNKNTKVATYPDAGEFLAVVGGWLAAHESTNSLVLGLAARLQVDPNYYPSTPLFKSVEDDSGLALAALMTPPHNLILASEREDFRPAVELLALHLDAEGWDLPGVLGPSQIARRFASSWSELRHTSYRTNVWEHLFELTEVIPPPLAPGFLRVAEEADTELVADWYYDFNLNTMGFDDRQEMHRTALWQISRQAVHLWDDGGPVSMATCTRPFGAGISIGPVYTPPEHRRRGYASACVAALSQKMLDSGYRYCALFTDLANPTSNHIYQEIGYHPVCDFDELVFETPRSPV